MKSKKVSRRNIAHRIGQTEVQSLESRQLLTGTVNVSVSRSGDISLIGDRSDNVVFVEISGGNLQLSSQSSNGTRFKTAGQPAASSLTVPLPASIRSLNISLGGGNDELWTTIESNLTIARDARVDMGAGNDVAYLEVIDSVVSIGQDFRVELGSGDDTGSIWMEDGGRITVGRDLIANTGSGVDDFSIIDSDLLNGADTPQELGSITDNTAQANSQWLQIRRDLKIDLGAGDDVLAVIGAETLRDVSVNGAAGTDTIGLSNLRTGRNLGLFNGEDHALQNMTIGGTLTGRTGTGADRAVVQNVNLGRLDVNLGSGNDKLVIGANVAIRSGGLIDGAGGSNSVLIATENPGVTTRRVSPSLSPEEAQNILNSILLDVLDLLA